MQIFPVVNLLVLLASFVFGWGQSWIDKLKVPCLVPLHDRQGVIFILSNTVISLHAVTKVIFTHLVSERVMVLVFEW